MPEDINESEYQNEMIFSNLALIKNNPENIVNYINALYNAGSACFAIKTTFFKEIQDAAVETANKLSFPLFLFDDIYIEELILEIDQEVNSKKQDLKKIKIINKIENSNLNSFKSFHESKISLKYSIYKEKYIANYEDICILRIFFKNLNYMMKSIIAI